MAATDLLLFCQERAQSAAAAPQTDLFTFVDGKGHVTDSLTFATLWQQSGAIAAALLEQFRAGDRLLLVYTPGLEFVLAFVACMRAGLVAVPIPPPDLTQNGVRAQEETRKLVAIVRASGAVAILTDADYYTARSFAPVKNWIKSWVWSDSTSIAWPDLPWIVTSRLRYGGSGAALPPRTAPTAPDRVAFLQFTSGSTSDPKGVRITFRNIAHQLAANAAVLALGPGACNVCWMPHFHDWALISHICSALSGNGRLVLLSPLSFLARPVLWLELAQRHAATHLACPPFALALLVRKTTPKQRGALRLGSVRTLLLAADAIKANVVGDFCDAFAVAGFRRDMVRTAFGLAEHSVGITMTTSADPVLELGVDSDVLLHESRAVIQPDSPYKIVSCGVPLPGVTVRIVDQGRVLADGVIGEVWADSDSKADGYEGVADDVNAATFRARVGDSGAAYLRTGDLGFLWRGQLYVTGRLKEILKVNGRTLHPVDLELCAAQASGLLRPGSVCAISISHPHDGGDRLVIVAEVARGASPGPDALQDAVDAVRHAILVTFSVACQAVVLGRPGQLVRKTTSGKIQRAQLRNLYLEGKLTRAPGAAPNSPVSKALLHVSVVQSPKSAASRSLSFASSPTPRDTNVNEQRLRRLCAMAHEAGLVEIVRELVAISEVAASKCPAQTRAFHTIGVGAGGPVRFVGVGLHLFQQRDLGAVVRFSNMMFADDRVSQGRGASIRLYAGDGVDQPLFDLVCFTGDGRMPLCNAATALEIFRDDRFVMQLPASHPLRAAHVSCTRAVPDASYSELHWFAVHTYSWHTTSWARFRFRHRDRAENLPASETYMHGGVLDPNRDPSFLSQALATECRTGDGHQYLIEVQIRPKSGDRHVDQQLQDLLILWDDIPWQPFAEVVLDRLVADSVVERLQFNVANSPPEIEILPSTDAQDAASSAHIRAIIYSVLSSNRCGLPLPVYLAPFSPHPSRLCVDQGAATQPPSVVIVGGGVSGLAAAMSLERRGYQVTVLESAANVGGKASSIWIDNKVYDWGGHLCNNSYHCIRALVNRFDLKIEPSAPPYLLNCQTGSTSICNIFGDEDMERFRHAMLSMTDDFGVRHLVSAPLTDWAASVNVPWREWIERDPERKAWLWPVVLQMNSCGYGFSLDHRVPLAFLAKLVAVSDEFSSVGWTLETGMQSLYDAMGDTLDDLRLNSTVSTIERRGGSVYVRLSTGEEIVADHVISTLSVPQTIGLVANPSDSERAVAGQVRTFPYYTTIVRCRGLDKYPIGFHIMDEFNEPDLAVKSIGHTVAWHKRYTDSDIFLFYSFGKDLESGDQVSDAVRQDVLQILGGEVLEIVAQRAFDFFPYASHCDLFYPDLLKIQGHQNLWHIGSIFNIELMEGNVSFAQRFVRKHFPRVHDGIPLSPSPNSMPGVKRHLTATERFIADAILEESSELFDPELVGPTDKVASFGITSVALPALASKFSDYTGNNVRILDCAMYPTINELGAFLDRLRQESQNRPAFKCIKNVRPAGEGTGAVLFMVHDGVGRTHQYLTSSPAFNFPLSLVQPYWEDEKADVIASIDEIAQLYVKLIRAEQPTGPWRLAGFSMGAMLAWRMSQMLGDVDRLILIDCPTVPNPDSVVANAEVVEKLYKQFFEMDQSEHGVVLRDQYASMPLLAGVRSAPTLVIAGSRGIVQEMQLATTPDMQRRWEWAIGQKLRFVVVEGATHMDIMKEPFADQVFSEIQEFLH